ncbi:NTP transferase domain-containing protein [Candidatus Gracilibacteria bacterium]|nr:NTP transferase domain-containing protein [Candidatus Gracilibacteria bacterium]
MFAPCATRHAVILAAGESKRTRPLTSQRPKPLIPLAGRALLAHILDELHGLVDRVTLVVGYRAAMLESAFGTHYRGIALQYHVQPRVNGTASALLTVADVVREPFFMLYGDNLISRLDVLGVCGQRYCMAALPVEDARAFGVLDIDTDNMVRRIIEKPATPPPHALANPGIFHFDAEVFDAARNIRPSPRGEYELTDVIELLAARHGVAYTVCAGHWVPVGTPWEALSAAQFALAYRSPHGISGDATIGAGTHIEGAVQIGSATIGANCRIVGPTRIGDGSVIGAGATIIGSSLDAAVQIGAGTTLRDAQIGAGARIGASCLVESSLLDSAARIGDAAQLAAAEFTELRPVAHTAGLLSATQLRTRGAVIAENTTVAAGACVAPGSVIV